MSDRQLLLTGISDAGEEWVGVEVVNDQGLVTSSAPDDLPAYCAKLVGEFAKGRTRGWRAARNELTRGGLASHRDA